MLTVVSCCMGGNQETALSLLQPICDRLGMKLVTISEWPQHNIRWQRETWLKELAKADIVVCVQRHQLQPAKSNGRVTQAQSLGLPVLASPLQAYKEAIIHGETGFICDTPEEWTLALAKLRNDPALRKKIGEQAKASAQRYSIDSVGQIWKQLLDGLCLEVCNPPRCDVIVPTWNNLKYLQECLKSLRHCTDWPYNIIVVNSGTDGTKEWLQQQPDIIAHHHDTRLHFAAANNIGLKIAKEKYVCFLNDDTIVAKGWLPALMHEAMKPGCGGANPFSNCDLNWLHNEVRVVDGISLYPGMTYENIVSIIPKLYDQKHEKVVTPREWLAMYCTVMPRAVIDLAGGFDEGFKSGCEDKDLCMRIAAHGYRFVTTYDAFVFHFGGTTRKNSEKFDKSIHQKEDEENNAYIANKYAAGIPLPTPEQQLNALGIPSSALAEIVDKAHADMIPAQAADKKRFVIYTGQAWERWCPRNIDEGGIGGSETATVYTAREFAKRGYQAEVYGDCEGLEGNYDGVEYRHFTKFNPEQPMDIFVSSRRADIFQLPIQARKKACVVHDIFLSPDPNANLWLERIDKIFVLSLWHKDFFCEHHRIPLKYRETKICISRDGVDLTRFENPLPRIRGRMIYSSSPDRGLDVLLDCLPRIRQRVPEAHVRIFYGFLNWKEAVKLRKNQHEIQWMEAIERKLNDPGVEYVGRIGQKRLAEEFLQAELFGYPTSFTETFAISAVEAFAAGIPVITTDLAALNTTVGSAGILLQGHNSSECYQSAFVDACCAVLTDKALWNDLSARGREKAKQYSWSTLPDEWLKELK